MSILDTGKRLASQLTELLGVKITLDPIEIAGELDAGNLAGILRLDSLEYPNNYLASVDWQLHLATPLVENFIDAWEQLDPLLTRLGKEFDGLKAEPSTLQPLDSINYPAFTIHFDTIEEI